MKSSARTSFQSPRASHFALWLFMVRLLCGVGWWAFNLTKPQYRGHTAAWWFGQFELGQTANQDVVTAFQAMGAKAVPFLAASNPMWFVSTAAKAALIKIRGDAFDSYAYLALGLRVAPAQRISRSRKSHPPQPTPAAAAAHSISSSQCPGSVWRSHVRAGCSAFSLRPGEQDSIARNGVGTILCKESRRQAPQHQQDSD
jgi:hypothetical protein